MRRGSAGSARAPRRRPARAPRRPSRGRAGPTGSAAPARPGARACAGVEPSAGSAPPTSTVPARAGPGALQRPQQRRLSRAVAAHERGDLARRAGRRRRSRTATTGAEAHDDAAGRGAAGRRDGGAGRGTAGGAHAGELAQRAGARGARRVPRAAAAASRARRPSSTIGGTTDATSQHVGRARRRPPCRRPGDSTTRSAYCTTRSSRCSAISTVTPRSCTSRVIAASTSSAAGRVERRRRLVEHEHLRVRGEHRADRDALQLAAGQPVQRAVAQLGEAEQVERLLDPLAHDAGRDRELLHPVGELFLDGVGDAARERVLADDADDVGELARRVRARVAPVDRDPARAACRR